MPENDAIAVIIILLFLLLFIAGGAMWAVRNQMWFWKRRAIDEEEGEE
jgi:uncharacterized protein YneF (UPF0154 family)